MTISNPQKFGVAGLTSDLVMKKHTGGGTLLDSIQEVVSYN
jgi:hypothetical protein